MNTNVRFASLGPTIESTGEANVRESGDEKLWHSLYTSAASDSRALWYEAHRGTRRPRKHGRHTVVAVW